MFSKVHSLEGLPGKQGLTDNDLHDLGQEGFSNAPRPPQTVGSVLVVSCELVWTHFL